MAKTGINRHCECGSGKKFKLCCMTREERISEKERFQFQDMGGAFNGYNEFVNSGIEELSPKEEDMHCDPVVENWWEEFMPLYKRMDIDRMLPLIYGFMAEHPEKFNDLGLHEECLFELSPAMDKLGRLGEYITLLEKIRLEFSETYQKVYGALDSSIIEYKVSLGAEHDIIPSLDNFMSCQQSDDNYIEEVLDLLAITGRKTDLKILSEKIYLNCESALEKLFYLIYEPYLADRNSSNEAVLAIAESMKTYNFMDEVTDKDVIAAKLKNMAEYYAPFDFSVLPGKTMIAEEYCGLVERFTGFLVHDIGCPTIAAFQLSKYVDMYIFFLLDKRKSKNPFVFNKTHLENFIVSEFKAFFYVNAIPATAFVQGIIYFHRFLNNLDGAPKNDLDMIVRESQEIYSMLRKCSTERVSCVERIFKTFPNFKGTVMSEPETNVSAD